MLFLLARSVFQCTPCFLAPLLLAVYLTILLMHLVCGLPHQAASLLLVCLRSIMNLSEALILQDILRDLRTIVGSFELEPRTQSYVCCPACFALHNMSLLPLFCKHQPTPMSWPCNTKLWKMRVIRRNQIQYPIRTYLHQDLKQWVAHFLTSWH
jgi:hypothetical protein